MPASLLRAMDERQTRMGKLQKKEARQPLQAAGQVQGGNASHTAE
jgi:hypothetical protein